MNGTSTELAPGINLAHQEVERIIEHLEMIFDSQPTEWLVVEPIGELLLRELGYEDMDDFEDALQGTFEDFMRALPHIDVEMRPSMSGEEKLHFKMKPEPPEEERTPFRKSFKLTETKQLYTVVMKAKQAKVVIPELEFEIGADNKRHIDTIYNHIGSAIFNLGQHARSNRENMDEATREKIVDTVIALNVLLDVERPWHFIVEDPSGLSVFKPEDGVETTIGEMVSVEEANSRVHANGVNHA